MAKRQIIQRERPLVLVGAKAVPAVFIELAREWEWDLMDLSMTGGHIPQYQVPNGAILIDLPLSERARQLRAMGCAMVRLGNLPHPQDHLMPAVLPDLTEAGRLAAMHMVKRGFKHVGFVGYDPHNTTYKGHPIYTGLCACARDLGLTLHTYVLADLPREATETETAKHGRRLRELGQWLTGLPKPVGFMTALDRMAGYVSFVSRQSGIRVPEEVAILGYGNEKDICEMSQVPVSSVDDAEEERVKQAMLLLRGMMNGEPPPKEPIFVPPAGVVARRSTDTLAMEDPGVVTALRFIWDHFSQDISIQDVAAEVGVSARSLQRAFQKNLGRGIVAELRRTRLRRLCELLRSTDEPVTELATRVGFHSSNYLHRIFREEFGTTPYRWRQRGDEHAEGGVSDDLSVSTDIGR